MTITFDPETYKRTTRQQWQDAAEAWHRWGPTIEDWLGDATTRMLDAAGVGTGSRVLDVAAGAGGQSIAAAHRVGPGGRVLATDIAPALLEYAAKAAADAGLGNVDTLEADGERLDVPEAAFDAAISRVGLIYFPNQQAALGSIRRACVPAAACRPSSTPQPSATRSSPSRSALSGAAPSCRPRRGTAGAVQPRRAGCRRGDAGPRRLPRHRRRGRTLSAAPAQRRRMRAVRARVVGALHQMLAGLPPRGGVDRNRHGRGVRGPDGFVGPARCSTGTR